MEYTEFFRLSQKLQAFSKNELVELLSKMNNTNEEDIEVKSKEELINLIMIKASNLNPNQLTFLDTDIRIISNKQRIMEKIETFGLEGLCLVTALVLKEVAETNKNVNYESGNRILRDELLYTIKNGLNELSADQVANIAEIFNKNIDLAKEILRRLNGINEKLTSSDVKIEPTTIMKEGRQVVEDLNK